MIKYVKDTKKTRTIVYILRDFDGEIIDVSNNDNDGEVYYNNGSEITQREYQETYWKNGRYNPAITKKTKLKTNRGFEKVHPFVFDADFSFLKNGYGGVSYDAFIFELLDGPDIVEEFDWQTQTYSCRPFRVNITASNFSTLMGLVNSDEPQFELLTDSSSGKTKITGFRGRWIFEFNKSALAVKPYIESK